MSKQIPEGYVEDARGALIPVESIKEIDLMRDQLVREIYQRAQQMSAALKAMKAAMYADIDAFVELSAERYGVRIGGNKGNIQLVSFDGRYKVLRAIAEHIVFDERLQVAKELIDKCLHRWTEGSSPEIRALIDQAFQVDKNSTVNTRRVLDLRRLKIDDPDWLLAMTAIADAISVGSSKSYVRVYERDGKGNYLPVSLDIAAL